MVINNKAVLKLTLTVCLFICPLDQLNHNIHKIFATKTKNFTNIITKIEQSWSILPHHLLGALILRRNT